MSCLSSRLVAFCGARTVFLALAVVATFVTQISPALAETTGSLNGLEYSEENGSVTIRWISRETLGAVDIPAVINGKPVTKINDYAFSECVGIERVSIPDSVRKIGMLAFSRCHALKQARLPKRLETLSVGAFDGCKELAEAEIPASVRDYSAAFSGCTKIREIRVHKNNRNYKSVDGVVFNREGTTLVEYPAGREGRYGIPHGVTMIGDSAFYGSLIKSVTMPDTVVGTGTQIFYGCVRLKFVRISPRLKVLDFHAFGGCQNLESVEIPHGVTEIGHSAFSGCYGLERVAIPATVKVIAENSFWYCKSLRRIALPDGLVYLGGGSFSNSGLVSVTIPKGMRKLGSAFSGCVSLREVNLPASLTGIEVRTFFECPSLERIVIPKRVRYIGEDAFRHCWSLRDMRFEGNAPELGRSVFGSAKKDLVITRYANATGFSKQKWKRFKQVKIGGMAGA